MIWPYTTRHYRLSPTQLFLYYILLYLSFCISSFHYLFSYTIFLLQIIYCSSYFTYFLLHRLSSVRHTITLYLYIILLPIFLFYSPVQLRLLLLFIFCFFLSHTIIFHFIIVFSLRCVYYFAYRILTLSIILCPFIICSFFLFLSHFIYFIQLFFIVYINLFFYSTLMYCFICHSLPFLVYIYFNIQLIFFCFLM